MAEPDYKEDLAFEPKMTFKDLCLWVKQLNNPKLAVDDDVATCECIYIGSEENAIEFDICGIIAINGDILNYKRTPAQMQTIIKALFE